MVSLAEKMAANMDVSAFSKATELKKRLWFTVLALIVFRLGTFIPLPGIDPHILSDIFARNANGILGMFNMFAGGALERMTIFALNIMPYISASIILQLGQSVVPSLAALKKDGEAGHRKITHYTKMLTVLITIIQGYGIAVGLQDSVAEPLVARTVSVALRWASGLRGAPTRTVPLTGSLSTETQSASLVTLHWPLETTVKRTLSPSESSEISSEAVVDSRTVSHENAW